MTHRIHSVLIVEDDPEAREHFAEAIQRSARLHLLASVGTCAEAYAQMREAPPDVLLTDLGLPDGHGIDLIRHVRRNHPAVQVLVISVFGDERTVIATVEAGANGYLLKDATPEQLTESLLDLIDGGSPISPPIAWYILQLVQSQASLLQARTRGVEAREVPADPHTLSKREIEVLQLLAKGFSSGETAGLLGIASNTVIAHCRNIYRKLDVNSRSGAIFEAVNLGLIDIHD